MNHIAIDEPATRYRGQLPESPVWDVRRRRLLWVDITEGHVFAGILGTDDTVTPKWRRDFEEEVGSVAVAEGGGLLVSLPDRLVRSQSNHHDATVVEIPNATPSRRTNDGKADPQGRFLVGTLWTEGASDEESLFRVEIDGSMTVIDSDLSMSNGLAWSPDGETFYSVDTLRHFIYRRAYEPTTGMMGERQVFLEIPDGLPDGICVDSDSHLWVAVWGRGEVRRFSPDGELVTVVSVPAPHVSSVAFAGPHLETLVITTAKEDLSRQDLASFPDSGGLFTVRPGVLGAPTAYWTETVVTSSGSTQ